jgi:hypothetical protein
LQTRNYKCIIAVLLIIAFTSVAYCAIIAFKNVSTTLRIKKTISIDVFDVDGQTPLESINLGDMVWYDNWYYPGKTKDNMPPQPAPSYFINDTDQTDFYVQFVAPQPQIPGITFTLWIARIDKGSNFAGLTDGQTYEYALTSPTLDPDHPLMHAARWYLQVSVTEPTFGDYAPVFTLNAVDSPTG